MFRLVGLVAFGRLPGCLLRSYSTAVYGMVFVAVWIFLPITANAMDTVSIVPGMIVPETKRRDLLQVRPGYLFGVNRLQFRDGDNAHILPSVQDVYLSAATVGVEVRKFLAGDLGVRVGSSASIPERSRNEFLFFDGDTVGLRPWKTRYQTFDADVGLVYDFALGVMPYDAGLLGGARYHHFGYASDREDKSGPLNNVMYMFVPYLGMYYVNADLAGFRARFDLCASPTVLSRVFVDGYVGGAALQVDGHSLTGAWYEASFAVSAPVTEGLELGLSCRYTYLELSGGATINSRRQRDGYAASTRFSMDSRHHLFVVALSGAYAF